MENSSSKWPNLTGERHWWWGEAIASIIVGVAHGELTSTDANDMAWLVHGFVMAIEKQLQPWPDQSAYWETERPNPASSASSWDLVLTRKIQARADTTAWMEDSNLNRPQSSPANITPNELEMKIALEKQVL